MMRGWAMEKCIGLTVVTTRETGGRAVSRVREYYIQKKRERGRGGFQIMRWWRCTSR